MVAASWIVLAAALAAAPQSAGDPSAAALQEGDRLWRLKYTGSALAAYEKAALSPDHAREAHESIARVYFFKGWQSEGAFPGWHEQVEYRPKALDAFAEALKLGPLSEESRRLRWQALRSLGQEAGPEPAPLSPRQDEILAEQIEKLRAEKNHAEVISAAKAFIARFPTSERLPSIGDALIESYQATPTTATETIVSAIRARIDAQPDLRAYAAATGLLLSRGALDEVAKLAVEMVPAAERFVSENIDSHRLAGKAKGALERVRASSADLLGWVLFLKGDTAGAEPKLAEAERLSRAQDFTNQFHMGELLLKKGDVKQARERYLNALSLRGGQPAQQAAAKKALARIQADANENAQGFDQWLVADLDRRREERRTLVLRSMVDRSVPELPLTSLSEQPLDMSKLKGKVLLYKFFASW